VKLIFDPRAGKEKRHRRRRLSRHCFAGGARVLRSGREEKRPCVKRWPKSWGILLGKGSADSLPRRKEVRGGIKNGDRFSHRQNPAVYLKERGGNGFSTILQKSLLTFQKQLPETTGGKEPVMARGKKLKNNTVRVT